MTSCCMVPLLCTPTQPAIHWIHCKKTRNAMPRMFEGKKGDCTVERCDTQSSQRDSEEVNSVEVLCPCFQLRQTRLSHEHNTFTSPVFCRKGGSAKFEYFMMMLGWTLEAGSVCIWPPATSVCSCIEYRQSRKV